MKFIDRFSKQATSDPEYLEELSTLILTGFMALLVLMIFI